MASYAVKARAPTELHNEPNLHHGRASSDYRYRNVFQRLRTHVALISSVPSSHHVSKIVRPRAQIHAWLRGFPRWCCLSGEIAPRTTHIAVSSHSNATFLHRQHTQQSAAPLSRGLAQRRAVRHVSDSAERLMRAVAHLPCGRRVWCGAVWLFWERGTVSIQRASFVGGQVWTSSRPR